MLRLPITVQSVTASWRSLFLGGLTILLVLTAVRTAIKAEKPGRTGELTRTAFLRWRPQILELDNGTDIYKAFNYPNPPIMALILKPMTTLPPLAGTLVWFALKALMAVLMAVMIFRLIDVPQLPDWAKALAIVVSLHPIVGDLSHGNVNIFIAFLIVFGLDCYRRQRDLTAGLLIALAIACKITPALFVPYFLWKRAWRTLLGLGLGLCLWWAVVPGAVLGFEFNTVLLTSWFDGMVKPFLIDGQITSEHPNQSLPGLLTRLFTANASFIAYSEDDGRPFAAATHTLVNLGPAAVNVVVKAVMLAFVAFFVWQGRSPHRRGLRFAAECGLIVLGMLLFSERTWKHHATTLLLPVSVLVTVAWLSGNCWLWVIVGLVPLLSLTPSSMNEDTQDLLMVYGAYTLMYLLLAMGMVMTIRSINKVPDAESTPVASPA